MANYAENKFCSLGIVQNPEPPWTEGGNACCPEKTSCGLRREVIFEILIKAFDSGPAGQKQFDSLCISDLASRGIRKSTGGGNPLLDQLGCNLDLLSSPLPLLCLCNHLFLVSRPFLHRRRHISHTHREGWSRSGDTWRNLDKGTIGPGFGRFGDLQAAYSG